MSVEQQDAVYGRLVGEFLRAKQKLAAISAELKRIGNSFSEVGKSLQENPERFIGLSPNEEKINAEVSKLFSLIEQYKETRKNLQDIQTSLKEFSSYPKPWEFQQV